jgi:hypothetical protein
MTMKEFPRDYSRQIAIVTALRRGFEAVKHHQKFTKRMLPVFERELPGYTVSLSVEPGSFGFSRLNVWGNGLSYDDGVRLSWVNSDRKPWQEQMAEDLDRQDPSDTAERQEQEISLIPKLEALETEIARLRAEAESLVSSLPIPRSARLRAAPHFWSSPSSALAKKFPGLFRGDR